jgi:hypothetical protein
MDRKVLFQKLSLMLFVIFTTLFIFSTQLGGFRNLESSIPINNYPLRVLVGLLIGSGTTYLSFNLHQKAFINFDAPLVSFRDYVVYTLLALFYCIGIILMLSFF